MELVPEFVFEADLGLTQVVGPTPAGVRSVVSVSGGRVRGDRISGTLMGAAADWVLIGTDGFARIDVRAQITTDDAVNIYVAYTGLLEMNPAVLAAAGGRGETSFDDHYFRSTPRLECGDPRYAWVNTTLFVGRGRLTRTGVEYEVHRLT